MQTKKLIDKIDQTGMALSAICLVHCLIFPILIATIPFLPILSFLKSEPAEMCLIVLALLNAVVAVTVHFKKHYNFIVPAIFISGALLFGYHFLMHDHKTHSEYAILGGAFLIGIGHFFNQRLCNSCKKCVIPEKA
jgi:hypothetical protein